MIVVSYHMKSRKSKYTMGNFFYSLCAGYWKTNNPEEDYYDIT